MTKLEKTKFRRLINKWKKSAKSCAELAALQESKRNKASALRWTRVSQTFGVCWRDLEDGLKYFPKK